MSPAPDAARAGGMGRWRLLTPPPLGARLGASGAIAAIELTGDVETAARALGFAAPPVGRTALRTLAGVDRGLVARPSAGSLLLFPHAGPAILQKLFEAFDRAGIRSAREPHHRDTEAQRGHREGGQEDRCAGLFEQSIEPRRYTEGHGEECREPARDPSVYLRVSPWFNGLAEDCAENPALCEPSVPLRLCGEMNAANGAGNSAIEARMLAALARTSSPLAIDLLLDQPRRWRETPNPEPRALEARSRILNRLLDPPTIVALGAPNIGKSTLLNALAGRSVSIVADLPGTTRDHVGVGLELAGLAVRWIDTPGLEAGGVRPEAGGAEELALEAAQRADLVVLCEDGGGNAECTMHNAECTMHNAECTMHNAECTMQNAECTMHNAEWPTIVATLSPAAGFVHAALRCDLAPQPPEPPPQLCIVHCALCIPPHSPPRGVEALVRLLRETLLPPAVLADPGPWHLPA